MNQDPGSAHRRLGAAWHRRVQGINVLKLEGDVYEMARQHGALLADQVPHGPLFYYRDYVEKLIRKNGMGALAPVIWGALRQTVGRRVARGLPDYARRAVQGLADGAGVSFKDALDGAIMADSLMWVTARLMQYGKVGPAVQHRVALGLGCTSAIAWGGATADGKLLHGRNLDYHGVGCWPSTSAVVFHAPDRGQRYVAAAAAGVVMGGVTAMNEAGLTLAVHQHMFTHRTQLGGTPIGVVGDRVMREAESLDDAEAILREYTPIGCWTYLVADGKTREVLCFEENPQRQAARRIPTTAETFGYANVYLDAELGESERDWYPSYWRANESRHRTANRLLDEARGEIDGDTIASILGHEGTTTCRARDAIGMLMTVGSVVFRPEDGVVWIASGEAPVSKNPYIPFSLGDTDHAPQLGELTGGAPRDAAAHGAFCAYRDSAIAYLDDDDVPAARAHAERARRLAPDQPLYASLAGLLALGAGDADHAAEAFEAALRLGHPDPERVASFHLWRGRAADLLGQRAVARDHYRQTLVRPVDPRVRRAAERGLDRPYPARRARGVGVDYAFVDVVSP